MNLKPVVSLADRRKARPGGILDQGASKDLGSNLSSLKQSADHMLADKGLLEEIAEEDLPDIDLEEENQPKRRGLTLEPIDEDNDEYRMETTKKKTGDMQTLGLPAAATAEHNLSAADIDLTEDWV